MKLRWRLLLGVLLTVVYMTGCGGGGGGSSDGGSDDPAPPGDTVAPVVLSTSPAYDSTGVKINRDIIATFSEAIDPATLTMQSYRLVDEATGVTVPGYSIGCDANCKTAILSDSGLLAGSHYVVTLTTGVKDLAGNPLKASYSWRFSTAVLPIGTAPPGETVDTTPPVVLSTFPALNALNVPSETTVVATFSEVINPSTINTQTFTLKKNGAIAVVGSVSYSGTSAVFKPTSDLEVGASYTATLSSGIKDLAGNALPGGVTWTFATAQADTVLPEVISISPLNGAQNVPLDSLLIVIFDEAIMPFDFGLIEGRPVDVTFEDNYTKLIMEPTGGLKPGTTYQASISVKDMAGNWSDPFIWTFKTTSQ